MKNTIAFLLLIFAFQSCQYFEKNVPAKDALLQQELKKINWSEVDEFPTIYNCDSITDKEARKQCFFDFLTQTIQKKLASDTLKILYPNLDTIQVKVTVFPDARIKFEPYFPKSSKMYNTEKIDSIMQVKLADFPVVEPAIKRGIKVKSQFVLPVILKLED
ncbi:hypothetical protein [Flavobacterium sp.]|uniref:hypothetical protein n=1 Tax=Flavobacterium sp. TaxID=239 RepID=UPI003D6AA204